MKPAQLVDRLLKRHFFQPVDPRSLSLFRFLYCTAIFWKLASEGDAHLTKFAGTAWYPIPLFEGLGIPLMSPAAFQILHYVLLVALLLTAVGACTRLAATTAWIAFFFYMGTYLGFGKSPHTSYVIHSHNIVVFILFILSVAPGVATYGIDGWLSRRWRWWLGEPASDTAQPAWGTSWPSQLIKLTLGLAYFGAGYCKVASHPLWADGYTLQAYLMSKHLLIDCPPGAWVAQHWWLCLLLGIATLALELTFFLIVFYPRLTWFYLFGAICFHSCIYFTMRINFFPYYGASFLIFLDWPTLQALAAPLMAFARRKHALPQIEWQAGTPPACGDSLAARAIILGLWVVLAVCIYGRIESWPFTDYRVFAGRNQISRVQVFRLAVTDTAGRTVWIPRVWAPLSPTSLNRRVHAHLDHGDDASLAAMLDDLAACAARCDRSARYQSIVIVERTLQSDPRTGGLLVIDRPFRRARLAYSNQADPSLAQPTPAPTQERESEEAGELADSRGKPHSAPSTKY
jgi:HTTM domain